MSKCFLITGASSGIGRALALGLPERGDTAVLVARRAERLQHTVAQAEARGVRISAIVGDVRDPAVPVRAVDAARDLGGVDVLINNVGGGFLAPIEAVSLNGWRAVLEATLTTAFAMSIACLPQLKRKGSGRIVNIGSVAGDVADPGFGPYSVAKAGLHQLTRVLAVEWGQYGIGVVCIAPGPVATEASRWLTDEGQSLARKMSALGGVALPEEIVACAKWLVSREARLVNGTVIRIDGGFTGWPREASEVGGAGLGS